ncbi:MAG: DedA family protein [Tateyamaria sp.]|uniref:DedA family protein n=1 Tax=Tateyamaria sp. TaxID=1929288 RepID=UPI00326C7768
MDAFSHLIETAGLTTLFFAIFGESVGLFLPAESVLIAIITLRETGSLSLTHIVLAAWSGAVLGNGAAYMIGRRFGRPVILTYGARFGLSEPRFAMAEDKMARHGALILIVSRFILLVRQVSGFVAGTTDMPWPRYLVANVLGATLWVAIWTWIGVRFGELTALLPWLLEHLHIVALIAVPALIIGGIVWWMLRRRKAKRNDSTG